LIDYNSYTQLTRNIMNTHSHVFEITCNSCRATHQHN